MLKIYNRCYRNSFKKVIQKTAEATGDLIGNKIADKKISVSKKSNNNIFRFFEQDENVINVSLTKKQV